MLSFELSNGRLYDPRVPTTLDDDDDQYVEYQLDDLTGIPSSAKEEQTMLMEAVKESLKDCELQLPAESSDKDESRAYSHEIPQPMEIESSLVKHSMNSTAKTTCAASDACEPLKAESNSIAVIHCQKLAPDDKPSQLLCTSPPSSDTSSGNTTNGSSHSDSSSASSKCSSEIDISHKTKATLTVIRNPASHVMNGLMRRWDFNIFRNSHNR
ncbi:hypothetical protein A2U01_0033884 [Trifolium medium]|uniref:Uncharacterized protein n=1 Tax=Trifolium medium TaxID=97028 RepID=A0A392PMA5_9FABA|nr:hypothetical protein [Trifolium medium]